VAAQGDRAKIYGSPTRRAIISFGRKNGKTALAAFLLLLHLCGPEAKPNSQLYSAAQSREQASVLFNLAAKSVRMSPDLHSVIIIRDTAKELFCPEIGTKYKALSADASTAYGLSPVFTVHDELGQVKGPAFGTVRSARDGIGRARRTLVGNHLDAGADRRRLAFDPDRRCAKGTTRSGSSCRFTKPILTGPVQRKAIRQANPAFGDFQNAKERWRWPKTPAGCLRGSLSFAT
jgi:hypothetical protein